MVLFEKKNNVSDPYACGIFLRSREKISGTYLVGHIPSEISRSTNILLTMEVK